MARVLLLIRSLGAGGAERQLVALASGLEQRRFEPMIATFYPGGPLYEAVEGDGRTPLLCLDKRGRWDLAAFGWRLGRALDRLRPDIVHCWLTEPNILGLLLGRLRRVPRVVWSLRASDMDLSRYGRVEDLGDDVASRRARLERLAAELGAGGRVIWTGRREGMPSVCNACDVVALSSVSEGFPNAVGEAMACGVPCVVTDAGDSAALVGDTGRVVPPGRPKRWRPRWRRSWPWGPRAGAPWTRRPARESSRTTRSRR